MTRAARLPLPRRTAAALVGVKLLVLVLLTAPGSAQAQSAPFCVCLRCLLMAHTVFYTSTSSMFPTLPTDTCFRAASTVPQSPVRAGDVIIFDHPDVPEGVVKRVIALAGQTVQLVGGRLQIDGVPVKRQAAPDFFQSLLPSSSGDVPLCPDWPLPDALRCKVPREIEILPNGASYHILNLFEATSLDDTGKFVVPDGHVFVLGDNRDNSLDSRLSRREGGLGFIPLADIVGVVDPTATLLHPLVPRRVALQ